MKRIFGKDNQGPSREDPEARAAEELERLGVGGAREGGGPPGAGDPGEDPEDDPRLRRRNEAASGFPTGGRSGGLGGGLGAPGFGAGAGPPAAGFFVQPGTAERITPREEEESVTEMALMDLAKRGGRRWEDVAVVTNPSQAEAMRDRALQQYLRRQQNVDQEAMERHRQMLREQGPQGGILGRRLAEKRAAEMGEAGRGDDAGEPAGPGARARAAAYREEAGGLLRRRLQGPDYEDEEEEELEMEEGVLAGHEDEDEADQEPLPFDLPRGFSARDPSAKAPAVPGWSFGSGGGRKPAGRSKPKAKAKAAGARSKPKAAAGRSASGKPSAKRSAAKPAAKKPPAGRSSAAKPASRKPAAKKAPAKKAVAAKAPAAKKPAAKKPAKKAQARKR